MKNFQRILSTPVKNEQGVMVYPDPGTAARQAVGEYGNDKAVREKEEARNAAKAAITKMMEAKKIPMPGVPIEQIDPSKVRGLSPSELEALKKQIAIYKSNL